MTYILAVAGRSWVANASDRLITTGTQVTDANANKAVLVFARDGFATIGYSGLAHLRQRPTDTFIAASLFGWDLDKPLPEAALMGPHHRRGPNLDDLFHRLRNDLVAALDPRRQTMTFTVLATGWYLRDGRWRPTIWRFHRPSRGAFDVDRCDPAPEAIFHAPAGHMARHDADNLGRAISATRSVVQLHETLAAEIRRVAAIQPTVGRDVMSILLMRPDAPNPRALLRYMPDPLAAPISPDDFASRTAWIVGPGALIPPFELHAGMQAFSIGGTQISLDGPPGGRTASRPQHRDYPPPTGE